MSRYIIAIIGGVIFSNSISAQKISTTVKFTERVFNFGTILEKNGKVTHEFVFQNTGQSPVVIGEVYSGCGCIGKAVSKEPVKPGKKGKVTITFDPGYKSGFFSKEIVVFSNNNQEINRIWVEGNITPAVHPVTDDYPYNFGEGLYLRLKVMAFGYLKPGETKQMDLHYANETNKEINLNLVVKNGSKDLKFNSPIKIGPKMRGVLNFSYTMPASYKEDVEFILYPYVNNKKLKETLVVKILNEYKSNKKEQPKQMQ